jgi:hypothetical protein
MTEKDLEVNDQAENLEPSEVNEVPEAVEAETSPEEITAQKPQPQSNQNRK